MGFVLIALLLIAVFALAAWQMTRWAAARAEHENLLAAPQVETLDYVVPEGQDPAVVLAALSVNGLEASADNAGGRQHVHIACDPANSAAREQARDVIEGIGTTSLDAGVPIDASPVRFEDER